MLAALEIKLTNAPKITRGNTEAINELSPKCSIIITPKADTYPIKGGWMVYDPFSRNTNGLCLLPVMRRSQGGEICTYGGVEFRLSGGKSNLLGSRLLQSWGGRYFFSLS